MQHKYDDYPQPQHALIPMPPPTVAVPMAFPRPTTSFSKCPLFCNLFAYFCCPLGPLCALPGMVYAMMGYSEHRVHDVIYADNFNRKSRRCAIAAIFTGLLFTVMVITSFVLFQAQLINWMRTLQRQSSGYQ